jgi:O-antigen/teichoic acid export membrane protein
LFWISMIIGASFSAACFALGPLLAAFYGEQRLLALTIALAPGFLFSAAGTVHLAILQRSLRYGALGIIEVSAQTLSLLTATGIALAGHGYWALVGASLVLQATSCIGLWIMGGWRPLLHFVPTSVVRILRAGWVITLNTVVIYVGFNLEKILIGRFWGAEALGNYGRAQQMISVPIDNLSNAVGAVAFSALARLEDEPERQRRYFLHGYTLLASVSLPMTVFLGVFAKPIFQALFGPEWLEAAAIFQLLAPTVIVFSLANPFDWLLLAKGLQARGLRISLVAAGLAMVASIAGLPYGPQGVAIAFSVAMSLWFVPHIVWCAHGGPIAARDIIPALRGPVFATLIAISAAMGVKLVIGSDLSPLLEVLLGGIVMLVVYAGMLLLALGQGAFYWGLIKSLRSQRPAI